MSNKVSAEKMSIIFGTALYNMFEENEGIFLEIEDDKLEVFKRDKQIQVGDASERENFQHGQMFYLIDSDMEIN